MLLGYPTEAVKIAIVVCQKRHNTRLVYEVRETNITHTQTHTRTLNHSHLYNIFVYTLTNIHTLIHSLTHTRTHTYTVTRPLNMDIHTITQSHHHTITPSHHHTKQLKALPNIRTHFNLTIVLYNYVTYYPICFLKDNSTPNGTLYINPCPGLVIDQYGDNNSIASAQRVEFYLNSHVAIQGE